jgi:DNA-binding beta-propeller fold protein YncE
MRPFSPRPTQPPAQALQSGLASSSAPPSPSPPAARRRRIAPIALATSALLAILLATADSRLDAANEGAFTNFETEPVRPILLSPDGRLLYLLNAADDRLEVWDNAPSGPRRLGEIAVGLRPVALAAHGPREVWVSNHLSDSVSVVDISDPAAPVLRHSLQVGDEPRDIVLAGGRIYVATARRSASPAAGEGQAELWIFEADNPLFEPQRLTLFGTKPRGLAVSPDGRRVYAGIFRSGNGTTSIDERRVVERLKPTASSEDFPAPPIGRILRQQGGAWLDYEGRDWRGDIPFELPDQDLWIIDAEASTPKVVGSVTGVGTILFNLAVQPGTGEIWVSNSEARNTTRFEPELKGRAVDSRISRLQPSGQPEGFRVLPKSLNPHLGPDGKGEIATPAATAAATDPPPSAEPTELPPTDAPGPEPSPTVALRPTRGAGDGDPAGPAPQNQPTEDPTDEPTREATDDPSDPTPTADPTGDPSDPTPTGEPTPSPEPPKEQAALGLSQATDLVFSADGSRAWAAVFGSDQVVELDAEAQVVARIPVGAGPGGLALDESGRRLFVLNHLGASLSVVDLNSLVVDTRPLAYDPRPEFIRAGQPFLYNAARSSANGSQSCASCHIFGDMDLLAWDLGVPDAEVQRMPFELTHENFVLKPRDFWFHPAKGPMVTQSLRGMADTGPLHWRGDRFATDEGPVGQMGNFARFRPAFKELLGRDDLLPEAEMDAFGRFIFSLRYPPNPLERLDRQLRPSEFSGSALFSGEFAIDSGVTNCEGCHSLPLGTNGRINFEGDRSGQDFKVPHLRNLYEKVGRLDASIDVISGYGFGHDGSVDTVLSVLGTELFTFPSDNPRQPSQNERLAVVAYLMAFDTGMAPAVGRQLSLDGAINSDQRTLLGLLTERSSLGDCDLIARARVAGVERGWLWRGARFQPDQSELASESLEQLLSRVEAGLAPLTFTCVPPGDGLRSALDRDLDSFWNGDERAAGSDPANPASRPDARLIFHIYLPTVSD